MSDSNAGVEVESGAVGANRLPPPADGDSPAPDAAAAGNGVAAANGDIRTMIADSGTGADFAQTADGGTPSFPAPPLQPVEIVSSLAALALWLILLSAGLAVSTQPYINTLQNQEPASTWAVVKALFVIATCHTATNTALLCCLAAFLGALGFRVLGARTGATEGYDRRDAYVAATTRGFFVFLIIQSGSIMLSDQAFTNLTLDKYIRLAGLSSLLSFTVGYSPDVFRRLMARVDSNFTSNTTGARPT